jgi:hypothetical protein
MKNYIAYSISILVIVISALLVFLLPVSQEVRTVFSLPGLAGLFSLLVQGWRDQVAHERALEIQIRQQQFDVSIASHMASVVFDRQVAFCEEYSAELYATMQKVFVEGPVEKTALYAHTLRGIRIKYAPWISKELTKKIQPFEQALIEAGTLGMLVDRMPNDPARANNINKMYGIIGKLLGMNMEGLPREPENMADLVLTHFADVLGVFDLEVLRRRAIKLAKQQTEQN